MSQVTIVARGASGTGTVTSVSGGNNITITGNPSINPTVNVSGTTNHAIQLGNASASLTSLTLGSSGQVLSSQGAGLDPHWITPTAGTVTSVTGGNNITITGTGSINPTVNVSGTTNHSLQVGNASASLTSLAAATDGQIPIGSTGANPVIATLTAGAGISVTNGAGSITIANTTSSLSWVEVTTTSQAMAINTSYIANNAGLVTLTLPAVAALGTVVSVVGKGAGGWLIAQNSGQTIFFGTLTSTPGVGGSLASTHRRDTVILACITANTEWEVWHGPQGNLTVV